MLRQRGISCSDVAGVYRLAGAPRTPEQAAALACAAGLDVVVSHVSAGREWGFRRLGADARLHVVIAGQNHRRLPERRHPPVAPHRGGRRRRAPGRHPVHEPAPDGVRPGERGGRRRNSSRSSSRSSTTAWSRMPDAARDGPASAAAGPQRLGALRSGDREPASVAQAGRLGPRTRRRASDPSRPACPVPSRQHSVRLPSGEDDPARLLLAGARRGTRGRSHHLARRQARPDGRQTTRSAAASARHPHDSGHGRGRPAPPAVVIADLRAILRRSDVPRVSLDPAKIASVRPGSVRRWRCGRPSRGRGARA